MQAIASQLVAQHYRTVHLTNINLGYVGRVKQVMWRNDQA